MCFELFFEVMIVSIELSNAFSDVIIKILNFNLSWKGHNELLKRTHFLNIDFFLKGFFDTRNPAIMRCPVFFQKSDLYHDTFDFFLKLSLIIEAVFLQRVLLSNFLDEFFRFFNCSL